MHSRRMPEQRNKLLAATMCQRSARPTVDMAAIQHGESSARSGIGGHGASLQTHVKACELGPFRLTTWSCYVTCYIATPRPPISRFDTSSNARLAYSVLLSVCFCVLISQLR